MKIKQKSKNSVWRLAGETFSYKRRASDCLVFLQIEVSSSESFYFLQVCGVVKSWAIKWQEAVVQSFAKEEQKTPGETKARHNLPTLCSTYLHVYSISFLLPTFSTMDRWQNCVSHFHHIQHSNSVWSLLSISGFKGSLASTQHSSWFNLFSSHPSRLIMHYRQLSKWRKPLLTS